MNRAAIAVAADSAVTVGKSKVHRTANKIFAICDSAPIGAMIYGAAELSGMPWETLIKLFRAERGKQPYATVEQCSEELRRFIAQPKFRNDDANLESLVRFAVDVIDRVRDEVTLPRRNKGAAVEQAIAQQFNFYETLGGSIEFDSPSLKIFRREAGNVVWPVVESVFEDIEYRVPRYLRSRFITLVHAALNSRHLSDHYSGLVLFGFNDNELFPSLARQDYDATPFGSLRTSARSTLTFEKDGSFILPVADREVMDMLIRGISENLKEFVVESTRIIGTEIAERIIKENLNLPEDEYRVAVTLSGKIVQGITNAFDQALDSYARSKYVHNMIEVVEHMSKEDLATIAEALVDVTALRIRASGAIESVSAPVDVCVVSKGDGLIWIKRKNYFDLSKNIQYLHRRFGAGHLLAGEVDGQ